MNFSDWHYAMFKILCPLKKLNINIEQISFDIVCSIYFINIFINSKFNLKNIEEKNSKKVKNKLIVRIIYSANEFETLQTNLKIKNYNLSYKKVNLLSSVILIIFILLFVVCLIKEVIL